MLPEIDFLPASYREVGVHRKNMTLRVAVVALFVALLGVAAVYQQVLRRQTEQQLADMLPQYAAAQAQTARLAELQTKLAAAEKRAELCAYLRHPWPRSRILAALAAPLPKSIELEELKIVREQITTTGDDERVRGGRGSEAAKPKQDPAQRDLDALRDEWDKCLVVVIVGGVTSDTAALHSYLDTLGRAALFTKIDLSGLEQVPGIADGRMSFTARLTVRPGYGQPDGPGKEGLVAGGK